MRYGSHSSWMTGGVNLTIFCLDELICLFKTIDLFVRCSRLTSRPCHWKYLLSITAGYRESFFLSLKDQSAKVSCKSHLDTWDTLDRRQSKRTGLPDLEVFLSRRRLQAHALHTLPERVDWISWYMENSIGINENVQGSVEGWVSFIVTPFANRICIFVAVVEWQRRENLDFTNKKIKQQQKQVKDRKNNCGNYWFSLKYLFSVGYLDMIVGIFIASIVVIQQRLNNRENVQHQRRRMTLR